MSFKWIAVPLVVPTAVVLIYTLMENKKKQILYEGIENNINKTIIVTGANSGLGRETVLDLAEKKATIIMACRNIYKCRALMKSIIEKTGNENVSCHECDVSSLQSVRNFAENINQNYDKVDVLINNAGIMSLNKQLTKDGFELNLGTNYLGHFLLTLLLLEKLKKSAPSRIVNVSDNDYKYAEINFNDLNSEAAYDYKKAYHQSKLALTMFTRELGQRLKGTGVTVNAVGPEVARTNLHSPLGIRYYFSKKVIQGVSAKGSAQICIFAALNEDLEKATSRFFREFLPMDMSDACRSRAQRRRLWAISEAWTDAPSVENLFDQTPIQSENDAENSDNV